MVWLEQWKALAARIEGLIRAGEFLASAFKVHSSDEFQVVNKSFLPELEAISEEITELGQTHGSELPPKALEALRRYAAHNWQAYVKHSGGSRATIGIQVLAPLAAFRSEFDYLIRDAEIERRSLAELAFEHLRRQLVVDEDVQKKWRKAFSKHETACERLGAVHLLSHGIWAFKIIAPGAATDLVFGDPVQQHVQVARRIARALVLTEWKLVRRTNDINGKAQEGRDQAAIYSAGILGDLELKRTRYVILVSKSDLTPPSDVVDREVTYRQVVIPTEPEVTSVRARSQH
jgi:hypothetical protein